jgi:hypothetical protein
MLETKACKSVVFGSVVLTSYLLYLLRIGPSVDMFSLVDEVVVDAADRGVVNDHADDGNNDAVKT